MFVSPEALQRGVHLDHTLVGERGGNALEAIGVVHGRGKDPRTDRTLCLASLCVMLVERPVHGASRA